MVTFRRNLRSLSPSLFSSVVSSSLPSPTHFSSLDVNAATDTLCSTLTSCLDNISTQFKCDGMCITKQQNTFKDAVMKKYVPKVSYFSATHSKYIFEGIV